MELLVPTIPVVSEFLLKSIFVLGPFQLFDKNLAVSAMMLPFAAYLKAPRSDNGRPLYFVLIILGTVLWSLAIAFDAPDFQGPAKEANLAVCYVCSGIGVIAFGVIRFFSRLYADIFLSLWRRSRPR